MGFGESSSLDPTPLTRLLFALLARQDLGQLLVPGKRCAVRMLGLRSEVLGVYRARSSTRIGSWLRACSLPPGRTRTVSVRAKFGFSPCDGVTRTSTLPPSHSVVLMKTFDVTAVCLEGAKAEVGSSLDGVVVSSRVGGREGGEGGVIVRFLADGKVYEGTIYEDFSEP